MGASWEHLHPPPDPVILAGLTASRRQALEPSQTSFVSFLISLETARHPKNEVGQEEFPFIEFAADMQVADGAEI
jgi:hypothetical protein